MVGHASADLHVLQEESQIYVFPNGHREVPREHAGAQLEPSHGICEAQEMEQQRLQDLSGALGCGEEHAMARKDLDAMEEDVRWDVERMK